MDLLHSIDDLAGLPGPISLAVGVFDGMHLGHQAVLRAARESAADQGGTALPLTFDPHPLSILRPGAVPRLLTSTPHKLRLMEDMGFSAALVLKFDRAFSEMEAEEFIEKISSAARPLGRICVGQGWHFGRGRRGTGDLLLAMGARLGFETTQVEPVRVEGHAVSSTRIRHTVENGDLESARKLLGRDFSILGTVRQGDGIGRQLGFPTANLAAHNEQFPPDGVYAVRVKTPSGMVDGVANIGMRPTITNSGERRLEVHLFDFSEDLYDRDLEVLFVQHLRGEQKFESREALQTRISADIASARSILTGSGPKIGP